MNPGKAELSNGRHGINTPSAPWTDVNVPHSCTTKSSDARLYDAGKSNATAAPKEERPETKPCCLLHLPPNVFLSFIYIPFRFLVPCHHCRLRPGDLSIVFQGRESIRRRQTEPRVGFRCQEELRINAGV